MKKGRLIGRGGYRDVYEHPSDPHYVIKVAKKSVDGAKEHNLTEAQRWGKYRDTKYAMALCPVIDVSHGGKYLIMAKAHTVERYVNPECPTLVRRLKTRPKPLLPPDVIPEKKYANWGVYQGRMVLIDYGYTDEENK